MMNRFVILDRGVVAPVVVVIMKYLDYHHSLIVCLPRWPRIGVDPSDKSAMEATDESKRSERHGRSGIHGDKAEARS